ncbi:MAG: peptidylprolyl isomerase [Actinobacteria bacterium]|nr:peptidylprolyl isomerase [Actinomycetota bacterium]
MPTEKRERQRAGRESRRAAARAAQKRAARRRQIISVVLLLAVVAGVGFFISRSGSDEGEKENLAADAGDGAKDAANSAAKDATTKSDANKAEAAAGSAECPPPGGSAERRTSFDGPPKMCIDPKQEYSAEVETDIGKFTIDLHADRAPKTVNNFVFLSRYGYYEGVPFHRVIPGFVVQGGDGAKGDGTGGPGYEIPDELPKAGEYKVGSVAMANSGPDTNGSQFFVVTGEQGASLPPNYSLFGTVVEGMDVVKAIEADGSESGQPKVTHKITKVTITEKDG